MKKTLIAAGVASLAVAVVPVMGAFADNTSILDTIEVTIEQSCTLTRAAVAESGVSLVVTDTANYDGSYVEKNAEYSITMAADTLAQVGHSTLQVVCNDPLGFKVNGVFTNLTQTAPNTDTINYSSNALNVNGAGDKYYGWTATKYEGSAPIATWESGVNDGNVMASTESAAVTKTQRVDYAVATKTNQAAGIYTGTATYTLVPNTVAP